MSRLDAALKNDLQLVKFLRDEIALQAHLLEGDIKQRWSQLENQAEELGTRLSRAQATGAQALHEAEAAASDLVAALKTGYNAVRQTLRH